MSSIVRPSEETKSHRPTIVGIDVSILALIAAVSACVPALWWIVRPWDSSANWPSLLALAVLTAIAQVQAIDIYGRGKISTGAAVVMAGAVLFGIPGALLLAPVVSITQWLYKRGIWYRSVFDLGTVTLSAVVFAVVYARVSDLFASHESLFLVIPAVAGAASFYLVNIALLTIAMALSEGSSPLTIWSERFRWLLVYYLVYGALALALALAYMALGISGLLAFMVPLVLTRYVMKQYIDHTEENVQQLEQVNQELQLANDEVRITLAELRHTYNATVEALSAALDSRDSETEGHSQRVANYSAAIARQLAMPEEDIAKLVNGALLHDVGKIGIPDAILRKPGPLNNEEWQIMQTHAMKGYHMLSHIDFLRDALPVVLHHHERYDGRGYPAGLRGHDIPLGARIFAVADTLDAITAKRPYRDSSPYEIARAEILKCSGSQFDPTVVQAFLSIGPAEFGLQPSVSSEPASARA